MTPQGPALIWCLFGDEASAAEIAGRLLDEGLIGCANILPRIRSLYVWRGARHDSAESAALFKTDAALLGRATARIAELHPYDSPAVLGWRTDAAPAAATAWLAELAEAAR
ncbi:MAG: divalent-cation tolerance protein CutA [Croceibacterium sp.]